MTLLLAWIAATAAPATAASQAAPPAAPIGSNGFDQGAGIDLGGLPASSPAVSDDGLIYVETSQGQNGPTFLVAFGQWPRLLWKTAVGTGRFLNAPAIGPDGVVYVSSWDHKVYAVSPDGHLKWTYTTGGQLHHHPTIRNDGTIYIDADDGFLYAIKPSGLLGWKYKIAGPVQGELTVDPFGTIYAGDRDGFLLALTPTGELRWKTKLGGMLRGSPSVSVDDRMTYVIASDNNLYSITRTGSIKWKLAVGEATPESPMAGGSNVLYVAADKRTSYLLDASGKLLSTIDESRSGRMNGDWALGGGFQIYGKPTYHYMSMYTVDVQGRMYALLLGMA